MLLGLGIGSPECPRAVASTFNPACTPSCDGVLRRASWDPCKLRGWQFTTKRVKAEPARPDLSHSTAADITRLTAVLRQYEAGAALCQEGLVYAEGGLALGLQLLHLGLHLHQVPARLLTQADCSWHCKGPCAVLRIR